MATLAALGPGCARNGQGTGLMSGEQEAGFVSGSQGGLPGAWRPVSVTPAVSVSDFSACSVSQELQPAAVCNTEGATAEQALARADPQSSEVPDKRPEVAYNDEHRMSRVGSALQRLPLGSVAPCGLRFSLEVTQRHMAGLPQKTTTLKARAAL